MNYRFLGIAAVSVLVWALPGYTHHSHGNYRMTEYTELTGTVS